MHSQLLESIRQVSRMHPDLRIQGLRPLPAGDGWYGTTFKLCSGCSVSVVLLEGVERNQVMREVLKAHRTMDPLATVAARVLTIPGLEIHKPIVLSLRVIITNLNPDVIAAGLQHVARFGCPDLMQ